MGGIGQMGSFWSGWIIVLTLTSLAGLLWLLLTVYFDKRRDELEVRWDDTLGEAANPAPWWWFWLILSAMVFSLIYIILYPGLGEFKGALAWTQDGQLHSSIQADKERHRETRLRWLKMDPDELALEHEAMKSAGRIFNRQCTSCHGRGGYGQKGFPNLRDNDWQWGDSPDRIGQTLHNGRKAQMPPWGGVLSELQIRQLTDYVLALGRDEQHFPDYDKGREMFVQYCASCHGEGGGNILLGAPNLTDGIWIYGGDRLTIAESIRSGRQGVMPPQQERLEPYQIKLLTAWLRGGADLEQFRQE